MKGKANKTRSTRPLRSKARKPTSQRRALAKRKATADVVERESIDSDSEFVTTRLDRIASNYAQIDDLLADLEQKLPALPDAQSQETVDPRLPR